MIEQGIRPELTFKEREVSLKLLEKYFEANRLGSIVIKIPDIGEVSVDLQQLFRYTTGLEFFEFQTRPDNIMAICVYGSVLYKHFEEVEHKVERRKKYLLFGHEQISTREVTKRRMPNDVDVMVITKDGLTDDKFIIPKRRVIGDSYGSREVIEHAAVDTRRLVPDDYGYIEVRGGANLHITYRSVEQFLAGIGNGDKLSESVIKYGIPIAGQRYFDQLMRKVTSHKREARHSIGWYEDLEGKLHGRIT